MSVKQIVILNTLIVLYKVINGLWPKYLSSKIKIKSDNPAKVKLRNRNEFETSRAIKAYTQNSIFYKGIVLYNKMPQTLRNESNLNKFKKMVKKYVNENF